MIRFSPAPGLSVVLVPVLAILLTLGVWQVKRLHWKTELLTQIEHSKSLPPTPLMALLHEEAQGREIAWRKAEVRGRIADKPVRFLHAIRNSQPAMHALAPFITDEGVIIVVDFGYINAAIKPDYRLPRTGQSVTLHGIVKPVRKPGRFALENQLDGLWFWPDTTTMLSPFFASQTMEAYVLGLEGGRLHSDWPEPAPAHVRIANNHLDYALTWFGLALAAFGVYLGWHVRNERLRFSGPGN